MTQGSKAGRKKSVGGGKRRLETPQFQLETRQFRLEMPLPREVEMLNNRTKPDGDSRREEMATRCSEERVV